MFKLFQGFFCMRLRDFGLLKCPNGPNFHLLPSSTATSPNRCHQAQPRHRRATPSTPDCHQTSMMLDHRALAQRSRHRFRCQQLLSPPSSCRLDVTDTPTTFPDRSGAQLRQQRLDLHTPLLTVFFCHLLASRRLCLCRPR